MVAGGCADAHEEPEGTRAPCEIARITATPNEVVPGDSITFASTGFTCDYTMEEALDVGVALYIDGPYIDLGTVRVERDGSFEEAITIPETTEAGNGEVYLTPETLDLGGPCEGEPSACPLIGGTATVSVESA